MSKPLWLRAVHRFERAIGEPLESMLHSEEYFDVIAELHRLRARAEHTLEAISRRMLHLANLPAGSDVRRVREQLSRVERQLDELSHRANGRSVDVLLAEPDRR